MAAALKAQQKMKIDYSVDRKVYDDYVKMCSHKGYAAGVVIEKLMIKYVQNGGQI